MLKNRTVLLAIGASILVAVALGLLLFEGPWEDTSPVKQEQSTPSAVDLGITYVSITSGISANRDLGVNSGALVTEVVPDSSADRAGVKVGDVIVTFNGSKVEEENPLLGMMMACPVDDNISIEVQTGMNNRMVEIVRTQE